jgi:negative regulator of sigma-B (phosphoserine phosphatase)
VHDAARRLSELTWGAAARTCPGETASGDLAVVRQVPGGTLVAALDGTGHGEEAARAAGAARAVLERLGGAELSSVVDGCHEALRSTRGAALSVAFISTATRTVSWVGVGNVLGLLASGDALFPRRVRWLGTPGGVAGHALPRTRPGRLEVRHGDVLILATDGVRAAFADRLELAGRPRDIAERILSRHWTGTDDAVALVVRFLGGAT